MQTHPGVLSGRSYRYLGEEDVRASFILLAEEANPKTARKVFVQSGIIRSKLKFGPIAGRRVSLI